MAMPATMESSTTPGAGLGQSIPPMALLVMMRQKKNRFKRQEYQTFIDWFISVPAKITMSGHQIELKLYEHHFYKADWEEFDKLIEAA